MHLAFMPSSTLKNGRKEGRKKEGRKKGVKERDMPRKEEKKPYYKGRNGGWTESRK